MSSIGPVGDPGPYDQHNPPPHSVEGLPVERKIPEWLKALLSLLAVFWSIGAVGGIWYIAHRIDATCDTEYVQVAGQPGLYQVLCRD